MADESDFAGLLFRAITLKDDEGVLVEQDEAGGLVTFTWDDRHPEGVAKLSAPAIVRKIRTEYDVNVERWETPTARRLVIHIQPKEGP